eukprot:scaffold526_cov230-Pinguiococcus_pyrenoidosus.AAC.8
MESGLGSNRSVEALLFCRRHHLGNTLEQSTAAKLSKMIDRPTELARVHPSLHVRDGGHVQHLHPATASVHEGDLGSGVGIPVGVPEVDVVPPGLSPQHLDHHVQVRAQVLHAAGVHHDVAGALRVPAHAVHKVR